MIELEFSGDPYGALSPAFLDVSDGEDFDLGGYVVDVTSSVTGNGPYPFSIVRGPGSGPWASLLCVIYQDDSLPLQQINLRLGAESLRNGISTATFDGLPGGEAVLHLFTEADQAHASEGNEAIVVNGATVVCCSAFDANQTEYGSYFQLPVNTVSGANSVSIETGEDWFGWHFVGFVSALGPVPVAGQTWGRIKQLYR